MRLDWAACARNQWSIVTHCAVRFNKMLNVIYIVYRCSIKLSHFLFYKSSLIYTIYVQCIQMNINLNWQKNLSMKIHLTEILFFLFGIALICKKWLITNINAPVTYVQTNNRGIYVYMRIRSFTSGMSFEPREVPDLHTSGAANATLIEIFRRTMTAFHS